MMVGTTRIRATLAMLITASVAAFALFSPSVEARVEHPAAPAAHKVSPYRPSGIALRAKQYYLSVWGVDNFLVRKISSGELVRFSFRVVDPARAAVLIDHRVKPHLIDPVRGVELEIPVMEQVGDLRQKGEPVANMNYWMAFSNKGDPVKAGDRVSVIIGSFRADDLPVE
ncbi:MAG TPA: hypothetical protein VF811_05530 [Parasulfuritortus sp.]